MIGPPDAGPAVRAPARGPRPADLVLVTSLFLLGVGVEAATPVGVAAGLVYLAPLLATLLLPGDRATVLVLIGAEAAVLLKWVGAILHPPPGLPQMPLNSNRLLTVVALAGGAALVGYARRRLRQHTHELDMTAARLRGILEASPDGVLVLDASNVIRMHNRAATHLLRTGDLQGRSIRELLPDCQSCCSDRHARTSATQEPTAHGELVGSAGATGTPDLEARVWLLPDGGPGFARVVTLRDVRERMALEERLRQKAKMESIGKLAGGLAHDLNNMFAATLGSLSFALEAVPTGREQLRQDIVDATRATQSGAELVGKMLAYARRTMLRVEQLDINRVVGDTESLLRRLLADQAQLTVVAGQPLPRILADSSLLTQVLMNLIVNARDAVAVGTGRITVETAEQQIDDCYARSHPGTAPGTYVMLSVSDNGCGMDDEARERAFEPFYSTKGQAGTGLGLAIVYGAVQQLGGHVWLYSERGRGTTFKLYFPVANESMGQPAPPPPATVDHDAALTVLVAEDSAAVREMVARALRAGGHRVIVAEGGQAALLEAGRHAGGIDLLLTDVVLPGMSGRELAASLRERYPQLPVLYMSGYTDNTIVHHGVLDARVQFLAKPFTPPQLLDAVRRAVRQPGVATPP